MTSKNIKTGNLFEVRLSLLGAFDRHNYGDILFPWIHAQFYINMGIGKQKISMYSLEKSEYVEFIGCQAFPLRDLDKNINTKIKCINQTECSGAKDIVIITGGEVLAVDWSTMTANRTNNVLSKIIAGIRRVIGKETSNLIFSAINGCYNTYPYVIKKTKNFIIRYHGVGGTALGDNSYKKRLDLVAAILRDADYISCRDTTTQSLLKSKEIDSNLVPDCAILMMKYAPIEVTNGEYMRNNISSGRSFDDKNYFVFQVGRGHAGNQIDLICSEIIKLSGRSNLSCLLVPIGRASGHEDHFVLMNLYRKLKQLNVPVGYLEGSGVFHIMSSIASSKLYVGTSLHGAITAFAFCKPAVGIRANRVKKLNNYCRTWMPSECYRLIADFEFADTSVEFIEKFNKTKCEMAVKRQCDLVESYLTESIAGVVGSSRGAIIDWS